MKRTRLWVCKCCGRAWRRKKKQELINLRFRACPVCGLVLKKAYRHPVRKENCKHLRVKQKVRNFRDRYSAYVRNVGGKRLQISKQTHAAFRSMVKAKTKPCFLRRANEFLIVLDKDAHNCKEGVYAKRIDARTGDISRSREGECSIPTIRPRTDMYSALGTYSSGILNGGRFIDLKINRLLPEIKSTFIHEVVHWLDSMSIQISDNHDCYWKSRLNNFRKKMRCDRWVEKGLLTDIN